MICYDKLYFDKINILLQSNKVDLSLCNKNGTNILMLMIERYNSYYFETVLDYLKQHYDSNEIKQILSQKNTNEDDCLLMASSEGSNMDIVKKIVELGRTDSPGNLLVYGQGCNYDNLISLLIRRGVDINVIDNFCYNALFYAYEKKDMTLINILLNHGIHLNHKNINDENILTKIINNEKTNKDDIYISNRIISSELFDVNDQDYNGNTVFHHSITKNKNYIVAKLLENKKINPNIQNYIGNTALMEAVTNDNWNYVELLLKHQSNINLKNNYGLTATDIATKNQTIHFLSNIIDKYTQNKKKGWFN
ncbi:ankyrin repeat protein [Catovirus CTV1]|uniref:Ankyrin repeat protein n=1 Tax=Catovirus CTV1 TaxID=1977631 RepID=A0A1V0S9C1_9VIRU|nr:ankyrin repeat protein [Catovirus CTV1]